jgi:catechol 2,3-dioxygenase-like lactoylglutathione lyase family enzyme
LRPSAGVPVSLVMEHRSSAVEFPTRMRAHIALACHDIERSRAFYEQLLGLAPAKVREGYVKFEVLEPPLNLTLNYAADPPRQIVPAHFGIQVKSTAEVLARRQEMEVAGFSSRSEEGVGCCYAIQDKVWFADPDGNQWEVFVVTEADIPEHTRAAPGEQVGPVPAAASEQDRSCCAPTCCK